MNARKACTDKPLADFAPLCFHYNLARARSFAADFIWTFCFTLITSALTALPGVKFARRDGRENQTAGFGKLIMNKSFLSVVQSLRASLLLTLLLCSLAQGAFGGWTTKAPISLPRSEVTAIEYNGLIYAV